MEERKIIKIKFKTVILMIIFATIIVITLFMVLKNNISKNRFNSYDIISRKDEDVSSKRIVADIEFKEDINGDGKKEKIEVIVAEWEIGPGSGDMIIDYNSYKILINNETLFESEPLELGRIRENDIIISDYDKDGIKELIIRGYNTYIGPQYEYIYKYADNRIKLIDINKITNIGQKERLSNLVKNKSNNFDDRILYNLGNIYLLGINNYNDVIEYYLYDSQENTIRELEMGWTTSEYEESDNKNTYLNEINNFVFINRNLMTISFTQIVGNIDYEFKENDSWNDISTNYRTHDIKSIMLHVDKENEVAHLIFRFSDSENYYYNYIPYYLGVKMLNYI